MRLEQLHQAVTDGEIDSVVVGFTDHYGRTMGKRFDAAFFLESCATEGTHGCDYLLTVDMEMEPVEGFAYANWERGYGDFHLVPDLDTLRMAGWTTRTAFVLCDVIDDETHEPVAVAPRSILRRQVDRLNEAGFTAAAASELEFFLFRDSYRTAHQKAYRGLEAAGWYVEDYHLLQASRVEDYVGAARRALRDSDIPVENSKGEAAIGQHELNIRYADALTMADRHVVMKQGMKELADALGVSVTFMAKPDASQPGNSCHVHLSLWHNDRNAFADEGGGRSDVFRWFLGGWMHHAADLMPFVAPTINSYKRYQDQSWAPTRLAWSTDNRTAGFRVVGSGSSLRIENRIPGGDVNPYLVYAAAIASGLDGIENQIEPPAEFNGDVYSSDVQRVPSTLRDATDRFAASTAARRFFGDLVVDHYAHHLRSELAAHDAAVTDWEMARYFERIWDMADPIIVAGGGIAGLAMALTCHQIGVPVRVFESSRTIQPLGVGINLQPNAVRELTDLGIADRLPEIGVEAKEWALVGRNGNDIWAEPRGRRAGYRWPQFSVHRGELQMLLLDVVRERCGPDAVVEGHRLLGYEQDASSITASFEDRASGRTVRVDGSLLIGADGLHSSARRQRFPNEGDPVWGGAVLWRGTALGSPIRSGASFTLVGSLEQRFVHYPIGPTDPDTGLQRQNWIAELTFDPEQGWNDASWNQVVDPSIFLPAFAEWDFDWLDIPAFVGRSEQVWEYPMVDRDPAPTWLDGRMALIGDAAHVMYPVGSNGASQAIVDTRVLGAALVEHGVSPDALLAYEHTLHEDISALVLRNRGAGPMAILGEVDERCGGVFDDIDDVIPRAEVEAFMARYKAAAGFAKDALNLAPPTIAPGAMVS